MERRSLWRIIIPGGLIFLGLALLCNNLGIVPGLWDFIVGLWPLLLILLGIALVLGWRAGWPWKAAKSVPINEPLGEVTNATLDLSGRAEELLLEAAGANSQDLLGGKVPEDSRTEVKISGSSALVRVLRDRSTAWWPWAGTGGQWELRLHPGITWSLRVVGGVGETNLNLADLQVTELWVDGHGGNLQIRLPRTGQAQVRIGGRLGDLTLRVPAGVAARIHPPSGTVSSARIDTGRFPQLGDVYQSAGFESADDRVEIWQDSSLADLRII